MRTFLGLWMWLIVSGDKEVPIKEGYLKDSVLLPCNCSGRDGKLQWQMQGPNNGSRVLELIGLNPAESFDRYKGRANIFVVENSSNCSLHLTDITAEDEGKYRCSFKLRKQYTYFDTYLNIYDASTSRLNCSMGCFKIIHVVLVLGLSLVMWRAGIE